MTKDRIKQELDRQDRHIAELGTEYTFPLFNSSRALESQRRSGYRTTAAAAREIVDNSIEAGASWVHVIFDRPRTREKYQRKNAVTAVAFIDRTANTPLKSGLHTIARFDVTLSHKVAPCIQPSARSSPPP